MKYLMISVASISLLSPQAVSEEGQTPRNEVIVLSEQVGTDGVLATSYIRDIVGNLRPGSSLSVISAKDGRQITAFTVEDKRRYRIASYILNDYEGALRPLQMFVRDWSNQDSIDASDVRFDVPRVVNVIGQAEKADGLTVQALWMGSPLLVSDYDPSASMISDDGTVRVPSDTLLFQSDAYSPYGTAGNESPLSGVNVHFCAIETSITPVQHDAISRFWALYISENGGVLSTFSTDLSLCYQRFQSGVVEPIRVEPPDEYSELGMIEFLPGADLAIFEVSQRDEIAEQLRSEAAENAFRVNTLENEVVSLMDGIASRDRRIADLEGTIVVNGERLAATQEELAAIEDALATGDRFDGITSFSRFQRVRHPEVRSIEVQTGVEYDVDDFPEFKNAWCYFNGTSSEGVLVRINLGAKDRGQAIEWDRPNSEALALVGVGEDTFLRARQSCRFPGEG